MQAQSLQDQFFATGICFGCGPANPHGLHVKSFVDNGQVIAHWQPQDHHHAFPGVLNGGIIGALLDCHSNWTAAWALMQAQHADKPPCTVTADYHIKLLRPTPTDHALQLIAKPTLVENNRATIHAELVVNDKVCATCEGTFVAVNPGHPAYHRW